MNKLFTLVLFAGLAGAQHVTPPTTAYTTLDTFMKSLPSVQVSASAASGNCAAGYDFWFQTGSTAVFSFCSGTNTWTTVLTGYTVGTAANNLVQLNSSAQLPAVSAALLTNFPALNQNTSGNAGTATSLSAGATGSILYQSDVGVSAYLAGNTAATDKVVVSHGTGSVAAAPTLSDAPALSAANMTNFPALLKIRKCTIVIGDPGAASSALADDNDSPVACSNTFGADWTIQTVTCWADAGSPTVTPILTGGSGTSILTGALTCGTAAWAAGTVQSSAPVVHSFSGTGATCSSTPCTIDVNITTAGGTAKYIVVTVTGTL